MSTLLEDYQHYYRVRAERYADDPIFRNSYASEKALYDAMNSCTVLDEFRDKLGNLNFLNAVALIRDKETARVALFEEFDETVRAQVARDVLAIIDTATDENDLITKVTEVEHEGLIRITVDELNSVIYSDFIPALERIEVCEKAEYPAEYDASRIENLKKEKAFLRESIHDWIENCRSWDSTWNPDFDRIHEARHRRRISIPDSLLQERISSLNEYL